MVLAPAAVPAHAQERSATDTLPALRAAANAARASGDTAALAGILEEIGLAHWRADRFDSALVQMLASRDLAAARGDSVSVARISNALGSSHYQLGNYELALQAYMRSLAIRASDKNVLGQAYLYANIAKAYQDWRQFDRALASADSGVARAEAAGDGHALGYALNTRADILLDLGRYADAREGVERSLAAYYSGSPAISPRDSLSAWSINVMLLGEVDLAEGRSSDALRRFSEIYAVARKGRTLRGQSHASLQMARANMALGRDAAARENYRAALIAADSTRNRAFRLEALMGLSRTSERLGDATAALRFARQHDALRDSLFDARTAQRVAAIELEADAARQRVAAQSLQREQVEQAAALRRQRVLTGVAAVLLVITLGFVVALLRANREVRKLSSFIPICASCKNVRDDAGYWQSVEEYMASRSMAQFSHSICNNCGPKLYGDDWEPHPVSARAPGAEVARTPKRDG
ncbi:MAG: hypothetical protein C0503_01615 [Gemmatimonas sp.]|nr:hypothetical protein [Gemmatimonas sp.]